MRHYYYEILGTICVDVLCYYTFPDYYIIRDILRKGESGFNTTNTLMCK